MWMELTAADTEQSFLVESLLEQTADAHLDDVRNLPLVRVQMSLQRSAENLFVAVSCKRENVTHQMSPATSLRTETRANMQWKFIQSRVQKSGDFRAR
jgi:hypothetical protein